MAMKRIVKGLFLVPMGNANAFLIEDDDGLALIDAGYPNQEEAVFTAITAAGRTPDQLKHVIFTHHHLDHIGSGAAIVRRTRATITCIPWTYPRRKPEVRSDQCDRAPVCCDTS